MVKLSGSRLGSLVAVGLFAVTLMIASPAGLDAQTGNPCPVDVMGDYNSDGRVTSADIINMICLMYKGCYYDCVSLAKADVNCSGYVTSADILVTVDYVFRGVPFPCNVCDDFYSGARTCP